MSEANERNDQIESIIHAPTDAEVARFGGFSKEFFPTGDDDVFRVHFKDAMHGRGETQEVNGTGRLREEFCYHFYRLLESEGIRTQIADQIGGIKLQGDEALRDDGILVKKLDMIVLELISRFVTRGNWVDEHKFPVFPAGVELNPPIVEFCLKWKKDVPNLDYQKLSFIWQKVHAALLRTPIGRILMSKTVERDDPRINVDVAMALHRHAISDAIRGHLVESREEWEYLRELTEKVNGLLAEFMESQGWKLEDGKFEAGIIPGDSSRAPIVADEYTQDSCRVRGADGGSITKDLHRSRRPKSEIYDGYARLTEAMKTYSR
jgi:phosphoribosylaminoimidazole-succinocarboxamide synthase